MEEIIAFCSGTLASAVSLWLAMKLTSVDGNFIGMLFIAFISALIGTLFVPLAGTIVLFILIVKATDADFFPDAVLMVIVSNIVYIGMAGAIASFFGS